MNILNRLLNFGLLIVLLLSVSACNVAPWERGNLAKTDMLATPDPSYTSLRAHVFDSKEASSGGFGATGGGCGCN